MIRARSRAVAAVLIVLAAVGLAFAVLGRQPGALPPRPPAERPALLLLTSLPLVFADEFGLSGGGSAALSALEQRYRVVPVSTAAAEDLAKGRLLLMAHPPAQTAENLVALDAWVRGGGRVLLLADPMSEWPSERPLGDPLRPSPMYMDTGLLRHWGLRLDAPDERGPVSRKLAGLEIVTDSPGSLSGHRCEIAGDGLVAQCRVGRGRATVVADSDFLDAPRLGSGAGRNLDALLAALADLESG